MIDTTLPPRGFSTGSLYTAPLRVYWLKGRYYVYDQDGWLCSCDEEDLIRLLAAQATPPTDVAQRIPWLRARALVYPGWELKRIENAKDYIERTQAFLAKPAPVKQKLTLKDLGL